MPGRVIGSLFCLGWLWLVTACSPLAGAASVVDPVPTQPILTETATQPLETPTASATPFQAMEPTPMPAFPLTSAGCCGHPHWGIDSNWVVFLDRPKIDAQPGLYGVPIAGGEPRLIHAQVGIYSNDFSLVAYLEQGLTYVERWADGTRWSIPNLGRPVNFSPSGRRLVWDISSEGITHPDLRQHAIWVSREDGSEARQLITVHGGGFVGWLGDEDQIIVSGRLAPYSAGGIWRVNIESGAATLLMEVERPREMLLSPEGRWLAFLIAFEQDTGRNGLWILDTQSAQAVRLDTYGSYRWRDEGNLLVIPFDLDSPAVIWQYAASTGSGAQLTDPDIHRLAIANNDWQVSPDGSRVVYVSSDDYALWLLQLPSPQP